MENDILCKGIRRLWHGNSFVDGEMCWPERRNLVAKKMCPKCESRDTAHIIWGEPNYSLELSSKLEKGNVFLEVVVFLFLNQGITAINARMTVPIAGQSQGYILVI